MPTSAHSSKAPSAQEDSVKRRGRKNKNGIGAETILEAVKVLLRTSHPEPLTQTLIAKAAGVDDKMIRYHFKDVDSLLDRLTMCMIEEFSERMSQASRAGTTATERIHARVGVQIRYLEENPKFFWLIFERFYHRNDEVSRAARAEFNRSSLGRLEDVVRTGRREGSLRKDFDPRLLYLAIIGMTSMFGQARPIAQVLFEGESLRNFDRKYQDFVYELVMQGIGEEPRGGRQHDAPEVHVQNLREENARLRDLLADSMLEIMKLKG